MIHGDDDESEETYQTSNVSEALETAGTLVFVQTNFDDDVTKTMLLKMVYEIMST